MLWVVPNPSLAFVSATTGWRIAGQGLMPHLSGGLSAGPPPGTWPGDSLQATTDGGATWTTVLTDAAGLWGLTFSGPTDGWAVGVDALYRTTDAGATWTPAGEPSTPLVRVAFAGAADGLGVTQGNALVHTTDGGETWDPVPSSPSPLGSVCFTGTGTAFAASARDGTIYASRDGGVTWAASLANPLNVPSSTASGLYYVDLACNGTTVWTFGDFGAEFGCGCITSYYLIRSTDDGATWRWAIDAVPGGPQGTPSTPQGIANPAEIAVPAPGLFVAIGIPTGNAHTIAGSIDVLRSADAGASFAMATISNVGPPADAGPTFAGEILQGLFFLDPSTGWMQLTMSASPDDPNAAYVSYVYETSDAGLTWRQVYSSGVLPEPPA